MSFPINAVGGYGAGTYSPATFDGTNVNSYARVTAIGSDYVVINTAEAHAGNYEKFVAGSEILIHVSATTASTYTTYLGKWGVAKITAVADNRLTLNINPTTIIPSEEFARYYVQAVTITQFGDLTLAAGTQIRPMNYSATTYYGGIVALKCSGTLTFDGGHINLVSCGIQATDINLRPNIAQENSGTKDVDRYAGWENFQTLDRFILNVGDGAAFIVAKNLVCHADSRIGNINSYGSQFCRGASDSVGSKPANVTNIGGSTILLAAESITNFTPKIISKYHSTANGTGRGLCRCYIATNTKLVNDEGLYAHDVIADSTRVMTDFNIKDFGDGSLGDLSEPTVQLNNYAKVTAISTDRKKISYTGKTTKGLVQITSGALVMVHQNHKDSSNVAESGRFILAKVLADSGSELTLNTALPTDFDSAKYAVQVVSIPQANNFTLSKANAATPKFNGTTGGILAIVAKGHCNLSGGKLNVEKKGGGKAYGSNGLKVISNSNMSDRLPIGVGHGSVFILAQELTVNGSTRIGATYSGASFGGAGGTIPRGAAGGIGGGYTGGTNKSGGGYNGGAGSGATYGSSAVSTYRGGYGANSNGGTPQGAHVMIIADTINNFAQAAISTGGSGGAPQDGGAGGNGGAGYGGGGASTHNASGRGYGAGGGYNGGGGGSKCTTCSNSYGNGGGASGWAFIYCNNAVNQNTSATVV